MKLLIIALLFVIAKPTLDRMKQENAEYMKRKTYEGEINRLNEYIQFEREDRE